MRLTLEDFRRDFLIPAHDAFHQLRAEHAAAEGALLGYLAEVGYDETDAVDYEDKHAEELETRVEELARSMRRWELRYRTLTGYENTALGGFVDIPWRPSQ